MDVARLNFSHGNREDHKQVYDMVRHAADAEGRAVGHPRRPAGPEDPARAVRGRPGASGAPARRCGSPSTTWPAPTTGSPPPTRASPTTPAPDDRLLVDDGKVGLRVTAVEGIDVVCRVTEGGPVSDNKGLSLPGMNVSVPAMSEKDVADLEFALDLRVDFIALSFVRSPADIDLVHKIMDANGRAGCR